MLNLLFISDSPKAEYIKRTLQPMLKVIIDVVTDFDHGLKDVFEKRPSTVCIQDQINGVTGESVARHIQMLLGNSAPKFIFLHTGTGKERAIKGLYEHLVDLSKSDESVAEDMENALKSLLGDQWEKIYIPPALSPASVRSSVAVPEESREDADKLVDDFLSDLETSDFSGFDARHSVLSAPVLSIEESPAAAPFDTPQGTDDVPVTNGSDIVPSASDELAYLLLEEANRAALNEITAAASSTAAPVESDVVFSASPQPVVAEKKLQPAITGQPAASERAPRKKTLATPAVSSFENKSVTTTSAPPITPASAFRVRQSISPEEEHIPEDLLQTFEDNYHSESRFLRRSIGIVFICIVCVAGGWYLIKQNPHMIGSLKQRFLSSSGGKQTSIVSPDAKTLTLPLSPPVPQAPATPSLPPFISKAARDASYPVKNPGWERYVGNQAEFRVFSAAGRIQAVQVLAVKSAPLSETLIKSILQEFVGSSEFTIYSRSTKTGVRIDNGRIQDKGEIKIYRKNGAIIALVISVN